MTREKRSRSKQEDRPLFLGQVTLVSERGYMFLWCDKLDSRVYVPLNKCAQLFFRPSDETLQLTAGKGLSRHAPDVGDSIVFRGYHDDKRENFQATSWMFMSDCREVMAELDDLDQFRVVDRKRVKDEPDQSRDQVIWQGRTIESFRCRFPRKDSFVPLRAFESGVSFEMRLEGLYDDVWVPHIYCEPEDVLMSFIIRTKRSSSQHSVW